MILFWILSHSKECGKAYKSTIKALILLTCENSGLKKYRFLQSVLVKKPEGILVAELRSEDSKVSEPDNDPI